MRIIGSMKAFSMEEVQNSLRRRERERRNAALRARLSQLRTPEGALAALHALEGLNTKERLACADAACV